MTSSLPLTDEAYWCPWCEGFDHGGTRSTCPWSGYLIWREFRYANFSIWKFVLVP